MFQSIVSALLAALSGDLASKIANAVEKALAGAIVPVLDMFARLAGIGDVPGTIRKALKRIKDKAREPVRVVLKKVGAVIEKAWNAILEFFGLKGANAVPEPDKWGQTNENKLWSEAGTSMITMSPGQRLAQALDDAVKNGADPDRVKPCQDLMKQHESITAQISAGVKQPQTEATMRNKVALTAQAKGVQAQLKEKLPGCLGGDHDCNDAVTKTVQLVRDGRRYTATIDAINPAKQGGPRRVCRVRSIDGPIENTPSGDAENEKKAMRRLLLDGTDYAKLFDAGHLIANSLGGPNERENLVPMHVELNRLNNRSWREMEIWISCCLPNPAPGLGCAKEDKPPCEQVTGGLMSVKSTYNEKWPVPKRFIPTLFDVSVVFATSDPAKTSVHHFKFRNWPPIGDQWTPQRPKSCIK